MLISLEHGKWSIAKLNVTNFCFAVQKSVRLLYFNSFIAMWYNENTYTWLTKVLQEWILGITLHICYQTGRTLTQSMHGRRSETDGVPFFPVPLEELGQRGRKDFALPTLTILIYFNCFALIRRLCSNIYDKSVPVFLIHSEFEQGENSKI